MIDPNELKAIQESFEKERRKEAITQHRNADHKMRKELPGGYFSGTKRGRMLTAGLMKLLLPEMEKLIELKKESRRRFRREEQVEACFVAELLGAETMLGITVKSILDTCGKYDALKAQEVLTCAGSRLRIELYRQVWYQWNPNMVSFLDKKYKDAGIRHKLTACKILLGRETGVSTRDVNTEFSLLSFNIAASWVLNVIAEQTGWFEIDTRNVKRNRKQSFVVLTPKFYAWFKKTGQKIEKELMQLYPMLCPPRDWSDEGKDGGYLNPIERVGRMIKAERGKKSKASKKQIDFINTMQKTSHEINPAVYKLQEALFKMDGGTLDSFRPVQYHPDTDSPMPDYIEALPTDHQARIEWRRYKAVLNAANNESRRRGIRTTINMSAARLFKNIKQFWIPFSCDTRGRAYVLSAGALSPQGSDAERSLLRFHEGSKLTDSAKKHLALHLANCYGITESHAAKAEWVEANKELITAIALDPLDHLETIESADEPFQFYAACDEYYSCVLTTKRKLTKLPVAIDATASGVQLLALLARDRECAEKVNLIPGYSGKQDIYASLAPLVRKHIGLYRDEETGLPAPQHLKKLHLPRKCLKANLLTRVYGSVLQSRRKKIAQSILEAYNYQNEILMPGDALILAKCFEAAMMELAPGALKLFDSLARIGKSCAKQGVPAKWTTPTGTFVEIAPYVNEVEEVPCGWYGRISLSNPRKPAKLNTRKIASSLAPSFVHSLDASILHEAFHDWKHQLITIHDCVATTATHIDDALEQMLKAYQTVLEDPETILNQLADDNNVKINWKLSRTFTEDDLANLTKCLYALC